VHGILADHYHG